MPRVTAGDPAPDFLLHDDRGTPHTLADARRRWLVLYFYPADDTPGCTREACAFRDAIEDLHAENAVVWGVSPQGRQSKAAFRSKYGLPFDLLADEDHAVAEAYGVWTEKSMYGRTYMGIERSAFLVDEKGKLAAVWYKISPKDTPVRLLEALGIAA